MSNDTITRGNGAVGAPPVAAQAKHLQLHVAIERVAGIAAHLDELLGGITGNGPTVEGCDPKDPNGPTLLDVLDGGPNEITMQVDRAHEKIEELRALLF